MLDEEYKDILNSMEEQPPVEVWNAIEKAIRPWYAITFSKMMVFSSVAVSFLSIVYLLSTKMPVSDNQTPVTVSADKLVIPTAPSVTTPETKPGQDGIDNTESSSKAISEKNQTPETLAGTGTPNSKGTVKPNSSVENKFKITATKPTEEPSNKTASDNVNENSTDASSSALIKLSSNQVCIGKLFVVKISGAPANSVLDFGNNFQVVIASGRANFPYMYAQAGKYRISMKSNNVVISADEILVDEKPTAFYKTKINENNDLEFLNISLSSSKYIWFFDDGKQETNYSANTIIHNFGNSSHPLFHVKLIAINIVTGCSDTFESEVKNPKFKNTLFATMPNVFTPNNDGLNDVFEIPVTDFKEWHLIIMNLNGRVVFETDNQKSYWNGKENNLGAECSKGTYNYIIKYKLYEEDQMRQKVGAVTLIRE